MKHILARLGITQSATYTLAASLLAASAACSSPQPANTAQQPPPAAATPAGAPAAAAPAPSAPGSGPAPVERGPTAAASPGPSAAGATPTATPASASAPSSRATPAPAPPPPPPPRTFTLTAGRPIAVYTASTLSTKTNRPGEKFSATLAEPITSGSWVIAKKGAHVEGVIVDADPGGRVKDLASIAVTVDSLTLADGRTVRLSASELRRDATSTKGKDAKKIGIATGVGAAIGAIAGGGKGAAIGAGVGGGAGTGAVLATRGDPAVIAAESRLTFTLRSPVKITEERER